jgi:hypothetical protein
MRNIGGLGRPLYVCSGSSTDAVATRLSAFPESGLPHAALAPFDGYLMLDLVQPIRAGRKALRSGGRA